jgi:hypothetical protein
MENKLAKLVGKLAIAGAIGLSVPQQADAYPESSLLTGARGAAAAEAVSGGTVGLGVAAPAGMSTLAVGGALGVAVAALPLAATMDAITQQVSQNFVSNELINSVQTQGCLGKHDTEVVNFINDKLKKDNGRYILESRDEDLIQAKKDVAIISCQGINGLKDFNKEKEKYKEILDFGNKEVNKVWESVLETVVTNIRTKEESERENYKFLGFGKVKINTNKGSKWIGEAADISHYIIDKHYRNFILNKIKNGTADTPQKLYMKAWSNALLQTSKIAVRDFTKPYFMIKGEERDDLREFVTDGRNYSPIGWPWDAKKAAKAIPMFYTESDGKMKMPESIHCKKFFWGEIKNSKHFKEQNCDNDAHNVDIIGTRCVVKEGLGDKSLPNELLENVDGIISNVCEQNGGKYVDQNKLNELRASAISSSIGKDKTLVGRLIVLNEELEDLSAKYMKARYGGCGGWCNKDLLAAERKLADAYKSQIESKKAWIKIVEDSMK